MMSAPRPVPVLFNIDVEPDAFGDLDPASPSPWHGYETAHRWLSGMRSVLELETGAPVRYCWLLRMDPQIAQVYGSITWVVDRYGALLEEAARAGDEIGLHPHVHRWDPKAQDWIFDLTDYAWIDDCTLSALAAFAAAFGRPCRTIDFGSGFNQRVLDLVDRAGVLFDVGTRPGQLPLRNFESGGQIKGHLPSFIGMPRHPYRPSRADYTRDDGPDRMDITIIPLTAAPLLPRPTLRGLTGRTLHALRTRLRQWNPLSTVYMTERPAHPNSYAELIDRACDDGMRHLAFVNRSNYFDTALDRIEDGLRVVMNRLAKSGCVFTTPAGVVSALSPSSSAHV